jgi:formamidopyrimidine-DNA glycosylase
VPELPEVETICWRLREGGHGEPPLVGRTLAALVVDDGRVLRAGDVTAVVGARVVDVVRRAKWITIRTSAGAHLLVHLVMTGDLHVRDAPPARFVRWHARLDDDTHLVFTDPRRFGHLDVVVDDAPFFAGLGPEPLDDAFTPAVLAAGVAGARAIKAILLDQAVVVGLGNIWSDEALHRAGLDPRRPGRSLDDDEVTRLHGAIRTTLHGAIDDARSEFVWHYTNRGAPSPFSVYDRAGEPCRACATPLSTTKLAGRTTVWCPRCQPAPRVRRRPRRPATPR